MSVSSFRENIEENLSKLSSERLRLVADFITFLVQQETQEESQSQTVEGSLLSHTGTWEGDDFEDCLQTVYETRSQIQV
mgnify:FL=1